MAVPSNIDLISGRVWGGSGRVDSCLTFQVMSKPVLALYLGQQTLAKRGPKLWACWSGQSGPEPMSRSTKNPRELK